MEEKKSILEKINKFGLVIVLVLVLILNFKSCNLKKEVIKLKNSNKEVKKSLDSVNTVLSKQIKVIDIEQTMEQTMLDFLIYEDELDSKKITLSQIKDKLND